MLKLRIKWRSKMDIQEIKPLLNDLFIKYNIRIAYLFGSQAKKKTTSLSDIDIAVLLPEGLKKEEMVSISLKLMGDFSSLLHIKQTDVIILNTAPLLLKFQVIKNGILLFNTDENKRIAFETSTRREYFDAVRFYNVQNQYLLKRLKEDRYGCRPDDYSKASAKIRRIHQNIARISSGSSP
jgi:hypothetical protein